MSPRKAIKSAHGREKIPMKPRVIHQNLDTSFVNLSALIKFLRRRQFVGSVKIELNGYKAEIHLKTKNQISVKENDEISGRVSEGKEALQRALIRTREPGGTISVFQNVRQSEHGAKKPPRKPALRSVEIRAVKKPAKKKRVTVVPKPEKALVLENSNVPKAGNQTAAAPVVSPKPTQTTELLDKKTPRTDRSVEVKPSLPDFPFELSNKYEAKARGGRVTNEEWQSLMKLTVEMLSVVDRTLATERLDFTAAFQKVRSEISEDYPFLNPAEGVFGYEHGRLIMTKKVNANIFVASIADCLEKILARLGQNPRFVSLHNHLAGRLKALVRKRGHECDRYGYTSHFRRILGP